MPEIRLQFVAESDLGSAMIRFYSGGQLSHVDAVLPDGRLFGARADRCGGQPAGVWTRPPDYARFSRRVVVRVPASASEAQSFLSFLRGQKGKPYDRLAILAFAFDRDWREANSWICSELIAAGLEAAGIFARPLYLAANKLTPVALALALSALPTIGFTEIPA